jgi:hypothetical protein
MTSEPAAEPATTPPPANPPDAAAASAAGQQRLRDLHHAAQRALDAAHAVLQDRAASTVETLPLLQLGWSRALEMLLVLAGGTPSTGGARPEWLLTSPKHALTDGARARVLTQLHLVWSQNAALQQAQQVVPPSRAVTLERLEDLRRVLRALRPHAGIPWWSVVRRQVGAPTLLALGVLGVCVGILVLTTRQATQEYGWHGQYFRNEYLSGEAVTQKEPKVAFYWDDGAPVYGLGTEHWSARFEGCLPVTEAGSFRVAVGSDDGSRVFVNGQPVVDHWFRHGLVFKEASMDLPRGVHLVRVEYFDFTRAANLVFKLARGSGPLRVLEEREVLYPNFRDGQATCDGLSP